MSIRRIISLILMGSSLSSTYPEPSLGIGLRRTMSGRLTPSLSTNSGSNRLAK